MKLFDLNFPRENYDGQVGDVVPGQALNLNELVRRFVNGQRLLVNQRPVNIYETDETGEFRDKSVQDEDERYVLPDIEDPVDLEEYIEEQKHIRKTVEEAKKKKKQPEEVENNNEENVQES